MTRNRRHPKADREHVLTHIASLVQAGNWITLDTETTGLELEDQVIEVAICDPMLPELPTCTWRIRPTVPCSRRGDTRSRHSYRRFI